MKKKYDSPRIEVVLLLSEDIITSSSGGVTSNENGINYGGVDNDGSKRPDARRRNSIWEDE